MLIIIVILLMNPDIENILTNILRVRIESLLKVSRLESIVIAPSFEIPWLLRVGRLTDPYRFHDFTGRPGGQSSKVRGSQTRE